MKSRSEPASSPSTTGVKKVQLSKGLKRAALLAVFAIAGALGASAAMAQDDAACKALQAKYPTIVGKTFKVGMVLPGLMRFSH